MERLTMIDGVGNDELVRCMGCGLEKAGENLENCGFCEEGWQKALKKLTAYEDTGLEPEEILSAVDMAKVASALHELNRYKELGELDRLRELVEADQDGRCVVLPCKIGDPVFMGTGRSKITGYEEDICDGFHIGRDGVLQIKAKNYNGNHGTYGVVGKTAELTREEAESALKGDQNGE